MSMLNLQLLPPHLLSKTGPADHADWNFAKGILGYVSRRRFRLAVRLLGSVKCQRLLEIGYGSGVFLPELARHCEELFALDIHSMGMRVATALHEIGVAAHIVRASATRIPFESGFLDCVVMVSSLEFVDDIEAASAEIGRILRPSGTLVFVMPATGWLLDLALRVFTGLSAKTDFGNRRQQVVPTLKRFFVVEKERDFPFGGLPIVRVYRAFRLRRL